MGITSVDKVEGIVQIIKDGAYIGRTAKMADTVISVPLNGFKKVSNIYVNADEKLVVRYNDSSLIIGDILASDEIRLIPKVSSIGAEGTIFYASNDKHVYVATA